MGTDVESSAARERIREAALAGFARDGLAATSIRNVAAAAAVSPGLVQHHFPTKDDLRRAVNAHVVSLAGAAFADFPRSESATEIQVELGDRVTALVRSRPDALLYVARLAADEDPGALEIFDAFVRIAEEQWRRLADDGMLRDDLDLRWTALHAVVLNLGTVLLEGAIDRHLPRPFRSPKQLQRWNRASSELFRKGVYAS